MKSKRFKWMAIVVVVVMAFSIFAGCNQISQAPATEQEGNEAGEVGGHAETGGESSEVSGDSANPLAINETYDLTKNGVRAILSYDEQTNSFVGTVENVSDTIVTRARVEVHLQYKGVLLVTGAELGPTTPNDLAPGQIIDINLKKADNQVFDAWTTHCEVGASEGGEGSESGKEGLSPFGTKTL